MADPNIAQPYFHLCPNLNIPPPPNGQLKLGTILRDVTIGNVILPLDAGKAIEAPDSQLRPLQEASKIGGFIRSLEELGEGNLWEAIADTEMLSNFSHPNCHVNRHKILSVEKLLVRYFVPTPEYIDRALEIEGVAQYIETTNHKRPVYMITGLIWTEGATKLVNRYGKDGFDRDSSSPFILGIRVRKIWWRKNGTRYESEDELEAIFDPSRAKEEKNESETKEEESESQRREYGRKHLKVWWLQ
ncbi:uncharacterized protein TrAtP1_012390 [Trichoderma atroviride]|uniref:Uncharacterized protein n=1 Tax=Hypocrea atroviridis (strain ATCC 20476 / IMI 206040) TaxID=452589 RepID=G9NPM5_HYPAI|nr:uncharacterized protein TRIATDRAFT_93200 [Trichoderma atroviride IMI 206040]EHK47492.1 hypothetical protein TRIATDRAFT_93200 [Trichoderma atroviride IMI 206040]UKZ71435.1 hypothetical protein TrAtP1_012390 [Trichoderma atroviride]